MNHIDALLRCVDEQTALLDDFIATLEAEGAMLLETPSDEALGSLTTHKNDYARRLAELDQTRATMLAALGHPNDRTGMEQACRQHPHLRPAFDALFERATRASTINQANGHALQTLMTHNQRALDTLRSLMGRDLYDAHGRLS